MPFFKLHLPMTSREQVDAAGYFKSRIYALIGELEQAHGTAFQPEKFQQSVLLYGRVRELSAELERQVALGGLSYVDFSECLGQNYFREAEEQICILETLAQENRQPLQIRLFPNCVETINRFCLMIAEILHERVLSQHGENDEDKMSINLKYKGIIHEQPGDLRQTIS